MVVLLSIILVRILFQRHRNQKRVCTYCEGNDIMRWHARSFLEESGDSFTIISTTYYLCHDHLCQNHNVPYVEKEYSLKIKVGFNFRYFKYGYLLRDYHRRRHSHRLSF
jgi:hypothetical protein